VTRLQSSISIAERTQIHNGVHKFFHAASGCRLHGPLFCC
jgi:hypothetical protein